MRAELSLSLLILGTACCVSCSGQTVKRNQEDDDLRGDREAMVEQLRVGYRIGDDRILAAMTKVRRHIYIPEPHRRRSDPYGDHPCPIGHGQTVSQPYIVAYMTEQMEIQPGEKVLEIGTGSGYQAAILAELGANVYTIEIVSALAEHARKTLTAEGYDRVQVLTGDGYKGWPEHAPYDAVIVTCAPEEVPRVLVDQLKENGRMIAPVGVGVQRLIVLRKKDGRITRENDIMVRFVPMVREKD